MSSIFPKFVSALLMAGALGAVSASAATTASVSGMVRDMQGTPQVGALVELLRADSTVVASVFTDKKGHFLLTPVTPGTYGLQAVGTAFLPALRRNLNVQSSTVVNLTLTTLFEAAQWLPVEKRGPDEGRDDWTWTLRSSANRPLLRMLEDGPLVVVTEGDGNPRAELKARVTSRSATGTFGDGGIHNSFEVARSGKNDRELILRADFSAGGNSAFESMVGFRQEMGNDRVVRTVVAVSDRPEIEGMSSQNGLRSLILRSSETMHLMQTLAAEVGSQEIAVRSGETLVETDPFATLHWDRGIYTVSYRIATSRSMQNAEDVASANSLVPPAAMQNGKLTLERGLHQEVGIARRLGDAELNIAVFGDHVESPVISVGGTLSEADVNSGDMLYDPASSLGRVAGPAYYTAGFAASIRKPLVRHATLTLACADGDAVVMSPQKGEPTDLADILANAHAARAQMYAVAIGGDSAHTGTRWRASYRWQPAGTVTAVAPYDSEQISDPYLSIYLRQSLRDVRGLPAGVEVLVDVRNLLAQGYRPFITSDGSTLYFAQADRSIQAGLSFTF